MKSLIVSAALAAVASFPAAAQTFPSKPIRVITTVTGGGNDLVRDLVAHFKEQGVDHVSLNVELPNDEALVYWRRLGFTDYRRSLLTDLKSLERRLTGGELVSSGSIHRRMPPCSGCSASLPHWPVTYRLAGRRPSIQSRH